MNPRFRYSASAGSNAGPLPVSRLSRRNPRRRASPMMCSRRRRADPSAQMTRVGAHGLHLPGSIAQFLERAHTRQRVPVPQRPHGDVRSLEAGQIQREDLIRRRALMHAPKMQRQERLHCPARQIVNPNVEHEPIPWRRPETLKYNRKAAQSASLSQPGQGSASGCSITECLRPARWPSCCRWDWRQRRRRQRESPRYPDPPQVEFRDLFSAVQMQGLYADAKTFPDAVPNSPPADILRQYRESPPASPEALERFVALHFSLPSRPVGRRPRRSRLRSSPTSTSCGTR